MSPSCRRCQLGPTVGQLQVATRSISITIPHQYWRMTVSPTSSPADYSFQYAYKRYIIDKKIVLTTQSCFRRCMFEPWFLVLFPPNPYLPLAINLSTPGFLKLRPFSSRSSCHCLVSPIVSSSWVVLHYSPSPSRHNNLAAVPCPEPRIGQPVLPRMNATPTNPHRTPRSPFK